MQELNTCNEQRAAVAVVDHLTTRINTGDGMYSNVSWEKKKKKTCKQYRAGKKFIDPDVS